jgi:hypothetical protein
MDSRIGCYVSSDSARCDIQKKTWTAPPKPADCDLDFGNGVAVVKTEKATVVCAGDTVQGAKEVLEYGEVVRVGSFLCDSESSGVRCSNEDSGRIYGVAAGVHAVLNCRTRLVGSAAWRVGRRSRRMPRSSRRR